MRYLQALNDFWMRQREWMKITLIIVLMIILFWIFNIIFSDRQEDPGLPISLDDDGIIIIDPETGKPRDFTICSPTGKNSCRIFSDKFETLKVHQIGRIKSKRKGSLECCETVIHDGILKEECKKYPTPPFMECP